MSLESEIKKLTEEIVLLNSNITALGEILAKGGSPYDDLPSDVEPQEEKPKPKPKPKAKKAEKAPEPEPEPEKEEPAGDVVDLLTVQKALTKLSKDDRDAAMSLVEDFTPAGSAAKLSNVPEGDYVALLEAIKEQLAG